MAIRIDFRVTRSAPTADEAERLRRLLREAADAALEKFDAGKDAPGAATILSPLETFCDSLALWSGAAPRSIAAYRRVIRSVAESVGDLPLAKISARAIQDWTRERVGSPGHHRRYDADGRERPMISRDTIAGYLRMLRTYARWQIDQRLAQPDLPLFHLPRLDKPKRLQGNRRVPVAWLPERLRSALDRIAGVAPHLYLALAMIALTGLRPAAIFALRWAHIHLPGSEGRVGTIRAGALKGGIDGGVPVPYGSRLHVLIESARDWFRKIKGRAPKRDEPVLFPLGARLRDVGRLASREPVWAWTSSAFARALRRVVLRLEPRDDQRRESILGLTAYVVRHSAITWLKRSPGVSSCAIQRYARHLRSTTQDAYAHVASDDGESAYAAIDQIAAAALPGVDVCAGTGVASDAAKK